MPNHRSQHNFESIKREINAIVRQLKDPRLKDGFINILNISTSEDGSSCRIFISSLEGIEKTKEAVNILNGAKGYIRSKIGEKLRLRYIPNLTFIPTDAIEYGINMSKKIDELINKPISSLGRSLENISEVANTIKANNFFYILTHSHPDGDTLGSAFALGRALQKLDKHVKILYAEPIPEKFEYLVKSITKQDFEPQYIIAVDLSETNLLDSNFYDYKSKIDMCIDHHISNKKYAKLNYVKNVAANCEIIFDLIQAMNVDIDSEIASALYTGIASDTGCFKYSNTTSDSHLIAAELMKISNDISQINETLFNNKTIKKIEIEKIIYENLHYFCNNKCAITSISLKEMESINVTHNDIDGIASIPIQIQNVKIGITIREEKLGINKVSVRTDESIDANKFCEQFNGGGHSRAAGFTFEGSIEDTNNAILTSLKSQFGW